MPRAYTRSRSAKIAVSLILAAIVSSCSSSENSAASPVGSTAGEGSQRGRTMAMNNEPGVSSQGGNNASGATAGSGDAGARNVSGAGGAGAASGSGGASGSGATNTSSLPMTDDGSPTWNNIFTFDFRTCRLAGCHGTGTAGLDMTSPQAALDTLINQPADPNRECAKFGKQRVVPGKPDESLLYLKLDIKAPCGNQMPVGGELPQKAKDRVKAWIEMGAKRE